MSETIKTYYKNLRLYVNDNEVVQGIDDELDVDNGLAHKLCTELWLEALAGNANMDVGSVQTLRGYTNLLAGSAEGFFYSITTDDDGVTTGLAWMTGTARDNFER